MYSWSVASMKKSIMFDVLNVIDGACRENVEKYIENEYSLLKKDTYKHYDQLFSLARNYDDAIAAAMYIPEKEEGKNRWTVVYDGLLDIAIQVASFNDLIIYIENIDRTVNAEYIMKSCLSKEQKVIPEDFIPIMIHSKDMLSVSLLNDTKLPERIKFSLITLLFNYDEFLSTFVDYLKKVHDAVMDIYDTYKSSYKIMYKTTKEFLTVNNIEKFISFDSQIKIAKEEPRTKYIIVLSLIRLEYSRIIYEEQKAIYIKGLFSIQRTLHDSNFKIF